MILRIIKKNFKTEKLPHELLLTTRHTITIGNVFANNIITKFSKIIKPIGFLVALLGKLAGPHLTAAFPLAKNVLPPLATIASSSAINKTIQINMDG